MKKLLLGIVISSVFILMVGCRNTSTTNDKNNVSPVSAENQEKYSELGKIFFEQLNNKEYEDAVVTFSDEIKTALDANGLQVQYESVIATLPEYNQVNRIDVTEEKEYFIVTVIGDFGGQGLLTRIVYNQQDQISGLWFNYVELEPAKVSENIIEEKISIGEKPWVLEGTLTLPANANDKLPVVIMVQGSGPSDRDESIGPNKPFRDIAWELAEQGIATIRYDKRTFTYGAQMAEVAPLTTTVKEEVIDDAVYALAFAKKHKKLDSDNIYILGHSLGGMLAPAIADQSTVAIKGIISLAGSPRPLWEIVYDQNLFFIDKDTTLTEKDKELLIKTQVEPEYHKAKALQDMTLEDSQKISVFSLVGYYFKAMDELKINEIIKEQDIPYLILHGDKDFQVFEQDFNAWKDVLEGKDASYIMYEGLNHLFMASENEEASVDEYYQPNQVAQSVMTDIANWIKSKK